MIIIYGTRGCGFCKMAVDKCKKFRLEYEYRDIGIRKWYLEYASVKQNDTDVPQIFKNEEYIGNYKDFVDYIQQIRESDGMA